MATLEQQHAPSYILDLRLYDDEDPTDADLAKDYSTLVAIFPGKSEMEIQHHLQEIVSADMVKHAEILNGLLYAILTYHSHPGSPAFGSNESSSGVNGNTAAQNPNRQHSYSCQNLARLMRLVQRDSYGHVFKQTRYFCQYPNFQKIRPAVREQLIWVVGYITESRMPAIHSIEQLHTALLKQIRGGDISIPNVQHAESTLRLLQGNQDFVDASTLLIAYSCYTYLRVILDHGSSRLAVLRQQEVNYCVRLLREKFRECSEVGRDLVRALQDVGRGIPEFEAIWVDLLYNPRSLNPQLESIRQILAVPSPKIYLASRLSYDMEQKLLHILEHIHNGQHFRNVQWFTERFLPTPESDTLYADIMRYICGVYHPANAVLAGPTVPRYALIQTFLRNIRSPVTASNIKLALMYDWLFFEPTRDSIMNIEPAMLLMERSIERAPYITAIMMEFLFFAIENYYPPLREYIQEHVAKAAQSIADKGVIRSFKFLYKAPQLNDFPPIREYMLSMFRPHVADPNDQNQGLPSSGGLTTDNPDDPLALGGGDEGSNGSGDFDGSQDEPQTGLEWNDDSGDEGSLPHKEPKKADTTTLSHRSRESSKEPMQVDETGPSSSSISSSALAHGGEDDQEEDEVMESSTDVGSSSKSSNVPPQVQSRTLLDWTMTDEDGADASEPGMGDNSNNASTTGSPDPEASLWIFGGLIHSFKSAYETDPASQETLLTFQKVCEVYEAGVGVESANMAQMFGQEICVFARKCNVPESYAVVRNRSKPFFNGRRAQDQDESMEEDAGVMGALMNCLWRITKKEGRQGAERVAQMLSNCEATVEPCSRLLSMWYLIGLVHGYRNCASSGAPITLEDALSLYGSYLQNAAERDLAQTPAEDGADMDQEERVKSVVQEYLVRDLQNLQDRQVTVFDAIVPLVLQYLSDYIPRTESFLRMVIFLATPTQIYYLSLGLSQRQFPLFSSLPLDDGALAKDKDKKNNVQENRGSPRSIQSSPVSGWEPRVGTETLEVIRQTLEWGTFDQMGIWQLIVSEFGGVLKAITGLLSASWVPSMTSDSQAEALGGLLNLIRTLSLSPPDIRLGTTIVRIASRTDIVSYDMVQLCQSWIGQSASTYPDHLGAILLSLSDKTAAPIWEELHGLDLGSPSSSVPTTPTPKATRSKIGSSSQSKRPKLTVKQRKEQGTMLRTALSLIRGWCETFSVEVTQQHFLRVWSAQVRSQVLDALTENFGVNEKEAWPKDWWIEDEDSVSQNDEDMENRRSDEDDDEDTDDKEDDGDDDEEGGRGNTNSSSRKKKMSEDEEEDESDQDQQSSDSDRRKKDKKRFGGAASGSASSSRRNSPKIGSGSSSTMGSNASTPTASKKGSFAGVLNSKSRSTRATVASTKKTTPARKTAASRRRKISEDDDEEEEEEEEDAQDDDEEEEEEEKESQDEMDEDEKSEVNGEEESNDEESEEETKGKKGKGKRPAKKVAAPATPAKRAATTRSQVKKPAVKPLTRSNRRTRKQEEEEDEDDEEDEDEDGEKEKEDDEEEDDNEGNEGAEDEDEDDDEEEEEEETLKKGKLPVYTQRRAAANANSKLLAGKGASAAATSSASKAKAAPKSRAKNKRRIVTDDESE